jgi:hypothetical protein
MYYKPQPINKMDRWVKEVKQVWLKQFATFWRYLIAQKDVLVFDNAYINLSESLREIE